MQNKKTRAFSHFRIVKKKSAVRGTCSKMDIIGPGSSCPSYWGVHLIGSLATVK